MNAAPPPRRQPLAVFAYMPWATTTRPSLALGLLTVLCRDQGVPSRTLYMNMDMSARVGFEAAGKLANERELFGLSDHLFACDLFGPDSLGSDDYLLALSRMELPPPFTDLGFVRMLRDEAVPAFLDEMEDAAVALEPTVVGFSATFNQVMGSLALGARVKRRQPDTVIIAGGACFDGEMGQEYHRGLPGVLDHVFMGEAEESFGEFLRRHVSGESTEGIPGVTDVVDGELRLTPGRPLSDMNKSPRPDFDDFFFEKDRVERATGRVFNIEWLPFESSRGCWWGEHKHCLFCGINDDLMRFREKDVDRVISELVWLMSRYKVLKMCAADWIISRRQRREIFTRLKELDLDIECFYETRADLTKEEILLMQQAGVTDIQPGIESFSTELLMLMNKNTSRIRHVQFLRWCKEYGIHLSYNVLAGFPGEQVEWYHDMTAFVPHIVHLQPPVGNMHYVEMHRFSPLFQAKEQFGVDRYELREDYAFNFPPGLVDPLKVGYFFSYSSSTLVDREEYAPRLREVLGDWIDGHEQHIPPKYEYALGPGFLQVVDTRDGEGRYVRLSDLHHDVFLLCDKARKVDNLKHLLAAGYPAEVADGTIERVVDELVQRDLLMREGALVLTLPTAVRARTTQEIVRYVTGSGAEEDGLYGDDARAAIRPAVGVR